MAHSLSAQKRVRQNETARARNRWRLKLMRDAIREFNDKLVHGTTAEAADSMRKAAKAVDRTASSGVIHRNQASRRKSRMSARLRAKQQGTTKLSAPVKSAKPAAAKAPGAKPAPAKPAPAKAAPAKGSVTKAPGKSK